jgi:molybdopterin-binding protein
MKLSARNVFKGKVKRLEIGPINTEVVLELPGGLEVVAVVTKSACESLGLAPGREAYAVIKASNVMLAVD